MEHHSEVEKYTGRWVAILDEEVVADGKDFRRARNDATRKHPGRTPLILYVPRKNEELLIV